MKLLLFVSFSSKHILINDEKSFEDHDLLSVLFLPASRTSGPIKGRTPDGLLTEGSRPA